MTMSREMRPARRASAPISGRASGFTLVDAILLVLVVGLAVVLLAGFLVGGICRNPHTVHSIAAVSSLSRGAMYYKQDHGKFPGLDHANWGGRSGSQILAASVFGYVDPENTDDPYAKADLDDPDPMGKYCAFKDGNLATVNGKKNVLSDGWPAGRDMAILYYPARGNQESPSLDDYSFADNAVHTPGKTEAEFKAFHGQGGIRDSRYREFVPRNTGEFILIAPGMDREYFTSDDITNIE